MKDFSLPTVLIARLVRGTIRTQEATQALGKRPTERQTELFTNAANLTHSPGHVIYRKVNQLLAAVGLDAWVENLCE